MNKHEADTPSGNGASALVGRERDIPVVEEFRANGGILGGKFAGHPVLLLHAKGAKSGLIRITPVMYCRDGERLVIAASLAGAPTNPAWFYNLLANPVAEVEVGTERFRVRAEVVGDLAERNRLFEKLKVSWPYLSDYESKTTRVIPIVLLHRLT